MNSSPLHLTREGRRCRLQRVSGNQEMRNRLASLGFVPGAELTVVRKDLRGSLIVSLKECRMALGREMACCMWVN